MFECVEESPHRAKMVPKILPNLSVAQAEFMPKYIPWKLTSQIIVKITVMTFENFKMNVLCQCDFRMLS